jgi:hypothetical protein
MSEESKKLTQNDPVDAESRKRLEDLAAARYELGEKLLDLEQERVKILVTANRIEEERGRLFEKILMERGLSPTTPVEIDAQSGVIRVLRPQAPAPAPQASPAS